MSILASQQWWIRTDGNELNGGGFDSTISGAGVNYSDQASPQLSLTDIVTTGTTTVTSVTGGFTSNMIGNIIRIAGDNYYMVTTRTNINTITVDRSTGTGTGQSGRIGGAWAGFVNLSTNAEVTGPLIANPVVPGNTINVRGSGSNNPTTPDYLNVGWYILASGNSTLALLNFIGYNGRPAIDSTSHLTFLRLDATKWTNFAWIATSAGSASSYGFLTAALDSSIVNSLINCVFDQAGYDVCVIGGSEYGIFNYYNCIFKNTGTVSSGSHPGITVNGRCLFSGVIITDLRTDSAAISAGTNTFGMVDCIIARIQGKGINQDTTGAAVRYMSIQNVTIDSCSDDGIYLADLDAAYSSIINCNITNNGGYGINAQAGSEALQSLIDYNNFYQNTSGARNNISIGSNDKAVDPQYVNASANDFTPQNTALKDVALPTSLGTATNHLWIGAIQPDTGGGGSTIVLPGIFGG